MQAAKGYSHAGNNKREGIKGVHVLVIAVSVWAAMKGSKYCVAGGQGSYVCVGIHKEEGSPDEVEVDCTPLRSSSNPMANMLHRNPQDYTRKLWRSLHQVSIYNIPQSSRVDHPLDPAGNQQATS